MDKAAASRHAAEAMKDGDRNEKAKSGTKRKKKRPVPSKKRAAMMREFMEQSQ